MENVGENFANSCRREDKMRREGGIVLKRKEGGGRTQIRRFQLLSGYVSGEKEGKISWIFFVAREGMQDEPRWVQRSSGSDSSSQKPRCQS